MPARTLPALQSSTSKKNRAGFSKRSKPRYTASLRGNLNKKVAFKGKSNKSVMYTSRSEIFDRQNLARKRMSVIPSKFSVSALHSNRSFTISSLMRLCKANADHQKDVRNYMGVHDDVLQTYNLGHHQGRNLINEK
mmetsp:Transcript_8017/g.9095  ORF Transcript_8017/g.9095 Transcript_8017/m.9095 type:complete len:136 (+) Transcript_8017:852-1259(+)